MQEMSKATKRRYQDPAYHLRFFSGHGLDIGSGDDPLARWVGQFARMESVRSWDQADGDAMTLPGVGSRAYDFVASSHCLEHLESPVRGLTAWVRAVKPGGFVVVTVPDFDLYESAGWPSRWNADHKWAFSMHRATDGATINLLTFLSAFSPLASVERLQLVRDFWQPHLAGTDQTLNPNTESCIEFVLRKHG